MVIRYLVVLAMVSGCAINVPRETGRYFSIEHGTARFGDAMAAAQRHCADLGMDTRHLGTDRAYMAISRFECVPR